jgi:hypothetical protein
MFGILMVVLLNYCLTVGSINFVYLKLECISLLF